jgi:hypothetical protein
MISKYIAALGAVVAIATIPACASPVEGDEAAASTEQAITGATYEVSVLVGDPINLVSAPFVSVSAAVGDTLHLNAVSACPTTCSLTWRDPDHGLARFGGVILGYGPSLSISETVAGSSRVSLTFCQKTSPRFSRCIATMVYITTT